LDKTIYEYSDYRAYLIDALGGARKRTGQRSQLAQHLGCQTSFISRVLSGDAQLSLEQAFLANSFFDHNDQESDFFLLLLQRDRAGSSQLKLYFQTKIENILNARQKLANRMQGAQELSDATRNKYYSAWHFLAIHMAVANPELQTVDRLSQHFHQLPNSIIRDTVDFLVANDLVRWEGGQLQIGPSHVHLRDDAEQIVQHHTNWRLEALRSLNRRNPSDLHYSVVYNLSREALANLREASLNLIQKNLKIVAPSPEETLATFTLDLFEI
jgi:uncharacterized protein (TIGR02147 family)